VNANIKPNESVDILIGADSYFDFATAKDVAPDSIYFASINNSNKVSFHNIGVFAQGVFKTPFANFTLGARIDNHSQFGSAFSPRVGITKAWDNFHIKALYSRAFRAPAIENIHASTTGSIKPELTGVAELEVGYKINDNMFVTANGFNIVITDPIVYYTQGNSQYYGNFNQSGSSGFEIDYRIKYSWGYVSANYSSYSAKNINKVPLYQDSTYHQNSVLSLPTGRFNLLANIRLGNIFSINPSINALSKRYTYLGKLSNNQSIYATVNSQVIANLFIRAKVKNIDAGIGVYNITDEKQYFIQAYSGGHMPLPGLGREIVVNFAYSIPFK